MITVYFIRHVEWTFLFAMYDLTPIKYVYKK